MDNSKSYINFTNLARFLLGSAVGLFLFMCPVGGMDSTGFNTPLSLATDFLDKFIVAHMPWLLIVMVALSTVLAVICKFTRLAFIEERQWLKDVMVISWPYVITRIIALAVTICVTLQIGPGPVIADDVGGTMLSLGSTLIALAISLSFALPFLTDAGLMEFPGIILKPVVRPLFKVPGRASLDLVASWLASSNTAVLITGSQYHSGFYSRREAATIMTNFSLVSIPFCMVVAETLKLNDRFPLLYGIITLIGLLLAVIGCRIYPLGTIPDAYCGEKRIREDTPPNINLLRWAFEVAAERASRFSILTALQGGWTMAVGIVFDIIPIVIAWGTIGTILVNETPIFQLLSYPMGMYMDLLGVDQAYSIAPQTVVGFIDMFIPALITSPELPEKTRFLVAGISLVQIIYMTEVGSIIIKADVGLNLKNLIIIFLERTIIAIPLIVLAANFFL